MQPNDVLAQRYRVIRRIGSGAMGQVWLADDTLLHRRVAIKHLVAGSQSDLSTGVVDRALREGRLAAQLNHPNAVQIFDLLMSDGVPHVVMEYVDGESLADRLATAGPLAPHAIRPVIRQIAKSLEAAHELGIVHRDVKPANILLAPNGVAKLADFGIARASQDVNLTGTGFVIGTPAFMAPEVSAGDPATPASDVWSLGATAYAATEGAAPFAGESSARMIYRKVSEPPPRPSAAGELTELVQAMMATEAPGRPSAREVAWALDGSGRPNWSGAPDPQAAIATTLRPASSPETVLRTKQVYDDATDVLGTPPGRPGTTPAAGGHRMRMGLIAAAVVAVLAITGGAVAFALASKSSSPSAAATNPASNRASSPSAEQTPAVAAPVTTTVTQAPTSTKPTRTANLAATTAATPASMRYVGPEGVSVDGPSSWDNFCEGADGPGYWCAGQQGFLGGYFRLRLKSAGGSSFDREVSSEERYFRTQYPDGEVESFPVSGWSVSSQAVDLVYTFTNSQGMARKGIERVFEVNGADPYTYIIATTDVRGAWSNTQQVFSQLVASAATN